MREIGSNAAMAAPPRVPAIPPCPPLLDRLLVESRAEEPDFNAVRRLIEGDVVLLPAFMAVVNGPRFGLPRKVQSLQAAMLMLGVRSTAMHATALVMRAAVDGARDPRHARIWNAGVRHAALCAMVAQQLDAVPRDLAHTYGLERDIGVLLLAALDAGYSELVRRATGTMSATLMTIERRRFPVDHRDVGARLAEAWSLPAAITWAVLHHHAFALPAPADDIERAAHRLIAIGLVADWLGWSLDQRTDPDWANAEVFVQSTLGVSTDRLARLKPLAMKVAFVS